MCSYAYYILCALQLETGQDEAPAHRHELADAELCNMQFTEFAASEQFTLTIEEVQIHEYELTDNCPGQLLHDMAVPDNNVVKQENSTAFELCDADIHHPSLASSSDSVVRSQLGPKILAEFTGSESFSETNEDQAAYGSVFTQEVNLALKQCTSISDDMAQLNTSITEHSDHSIVSVGLSDIRSVDHDGALSTDRDDLTSRCSKSDNESMIVHHSWYSDISECESCHKDAHSSSVHDSCSADADTGTSEVPHTDLMCHTSASSPTCTTEQTATYMANDPEVYDVASSLVCENSRFADISIDCRAQHAKLMLDSSELEAVGSNEDEEQMIQKRLSSLFSCILDKTEELNLGFLSAVDFQQNGNCPNADIYTSLGGMELLGDMELVPVQDEKNGRDDDTEGTDAICDLKNYLDSMTKTTCLSNLDDCAAAAVCASLGGMELCEDMELISVEDEKPDSMHNTEYAETNCDVKNYSDSTVNFTNLNCDNDWTYDDDNAQHEFSQVTTDIPEAYKSTTASRNEELAEIMSDEVVGISDVLDRDDNFGMLPQPSDSGTRLLLTHENLSVSDHRLQCTDMAHKNSAQETQQCHMLILTDEVSHSDVEYSEPTAALNEIGRNSSMAFTSATASVKSVVETENVDMLISLETTNSTGTVSTEVMDMAVFNNASEVEKSYLSNSKNLEIVENGENENSEVLAESLDSRIRLPEHLAVSAQMLQCTDTADDHGGQEITHSHLLLGSTDEICDSDNKSTNVETENDVDMLISLETTEFAGTDLTKVMDMAVFNNASEVENSYLSDSKNLEIVENGENENSEVLAESLDSGIRLLEQLGVSDQMLQCTDTADHHGGQEMTYSHLLLGSTDEICDSDNKSTNVETENVDMLISLETTNFAGTDLTKVMDMAVFNNESELENSYLSNSKNLEIVENGENENSEVLAESLDSGIRLLEHLPESDQMLQSIDTADDHGGQEMTYSHLLLDEVSDHDNKPTAVEDEDCRTPSVVLVSETASISAAETINVDTQISLETINKDSACTLLTEAEDSHLDNSKDLENGKNENSTNTGHRSAVRAAHTTCADQEFHTGTGSSDTSITEHQPDLLSPKDEDILSAVYYANEDFQLFIYESGHQLEPFTVNNTSLHTQRLELDDLTLTVTCFIPEESEELLPDGDALEQLNESNDLEVELRSPPYSTKPTGSDPVISFDLSHHMDHNITAVDRTLSKHRSSEFMLSHLMPIDETAEFTHDASTDIDYIVEDRIRLLQPANELDDLKTESGDDDEQKMHISASGTAEHAHHMCHKLTERVEQDDEQPSGAKNPGLDSSASNAYGVGMTVITNNGRTLNSSDDKQQITYKENHSAVDHFNANITLPFSANQQDTVNDEASINKYKSEDSVDVVACNSEAATNGTQVDYLLDESNEDATTAEHTTLTTKLPFHTFSVDHTTNTDASMLLAAGATQYSSSSVEESAESSVSDLGDEHSPGTNALKQNKFEGVNDATEYLDNKGKNTMTIKTSCDEALLDENSVTATSALKNQNDSQKQNAENAMELCDRPVFRSNNMQSVLDAIMQSLVSSYETADSTHHSITEEQPSSHMATDDRDAPHKLSSVLNSSLPAFVVQPAMEVEEPAVDAVTDFESILEQLHWTGHSA